MGFLIKVPAAGIVCAFNRTFESLARMPPTPPNLVFINSASFSERPNLIFYNSANIPVPPDLFTTPQAFLSVQTLYFTTPQASKLQESSTGFFLIKRTDGVIGPFNILTAQDSRT